MADKDNKKNKTTKLKGDANTNSEKDPKHSKRDANKNMHNKTLGQRGEDAACAYLKNKGYEIVAKNWKCNAGEADIIALIDDTLVFVEVKTRSNLDKGLPEDSVDAKKRNKYERIAALYLRQSSFCDMSMRFDVIAILTVNNSKAMLRHHINAFGVS